MLPRSDTILRCASCAVAPLHGGPGYRVTPWSLQSIQAWYERGQRGASRVGALRLTAAQLLGVQCRKTALRLCAARPTVLWWLYWELSHREADGGGAQAPSTQCVVLLPLLRRGCLPPPEVVRRPVSSSLLRPGDTTC
jgi:hypothetical protein